MIYGYCRISTSKQNIERQQRNIKGAYAEAIIIKEEYTGTKVEGRKEFNKLLKMVKEKDTIVFDSVSRFSRNAKEAIELSQETPEWQKVNQKDKNTMMELDNQARDLYYEQKKNEKEEERNRQDEEFTVEKAIEYAEDYSLRTGLDTLRVEVDETPQYDEEGRKYYNVGVYIIELDELNDAYRVYSGGKIRRLD